MITKYFIDDVITLKYLLANRSISNNTDSLRAATSAQATNRSRSTLDLGLHQGLLLKVNSLFPIIPGIGLIYTKGGTISLTRLLFIPQQKISLRFPTLLPSIFSFRKSRCSLPQSISSRVEISWVSLCPDVYSPYTHALRSRTCKFNGDLWR